MCSYSKRRKGTTGEPDWVHSHSRESSLLDEEWAVYIPYTFFKFDLREKYDPSDLHLTVPGSCNK